MVKNYLCPFAGIQIYRSVLRRTIAFLCLLFIFLVKGALAQHYPSRNFTTADGLPNNAIHALHMDSRGILWVGTENGISKMENGRFENFYEKDGLAFNSCWAIGEDKNGKLWFGSYGGGVTIFDGKKEQIINIENGLTDNRIREFFAYKNWMIVGTEDGITLIDINTLEVTPVQSSVKNNGMNYVTGIIERDGKIYFSSYRNGFYELFWENGAPDTKLLNDWLPIYSFHLDADTFLLADKGKLHRVNFDEFIVGKTPSKTFGQSIVWNTLPLSPSKTLMLANGLYTKTGGAFFYENGKMNDVTELMGISSNFINSGTYNEKFKTLFVGSQDQGIFEINMAERIAYFPMEGQEVNGFAGDENTLGILSTNGLSIRTNSPSPIKIELKIFKQTQHAFYQNHPNRIPEHMDGFYELDPEIRAEDIDFYELHWQDNSFWINTNIGIYEINTFGKIITYLPVHCYSMGFTPDGKLMETSPYAGVRIYSDPGAMKFEYFEPEDENTPLQVVKVIQGKNDSYLASVFFGLYRYDGERFYSYLKSGIWDEIKLKTLHQMDSGDILVGTEFGEMFQISGEKEFEVKRKWSKDEILGNSMLFIKSYEELILIGSELGIQVIANDYSRLLDTEQGIHEKITLGAKRIGDFLYLGTNKGYYQLDLPALLNEKSTEIELMISDLRINHQAVSSDNFMWFRYIGKDLKLDSDENTIQVSFLPKNNLHPKKLRYRYRLTNTAIWSDYSEDTNLDLPFLPSGSYNLEIDVLDNHSGENKVSSILKFTIDRPYYLKWWFILLVILAMAGLFTLIYKVRIKEVRLKSQMKERMSEIKLESLRSQMNPHFIFNALNSIQYFILKRDIGEALTYLNQFSKLVRLTLTHLASTSITLKQEIEYLERYIIVENSRIDERATWKITGNALEKADKINLAPMLIQPLVENVFVHAFPNDYDDPKLEVRIDLKENFLICSITDNGTGFNPSKTAKESKGMSIIRERLQLLGSEETDPIQILSHSGTTLTIKIPVTIS